MSTDNQNSTKNILILFFDENEPNLFFSWYYIFHFILSFIQKLDEYNFLLSDRCMNLSLFVSYVDKIKLIGNGREIK